MSPEHQQPDRRQQADRRAHERRQKQLGVPAGFMERRRAERRRSHERRRNLELQAQGYLPDSGRCPLCGDIQSHLKDICSRCSGRLPWADSDAPNHAAASIGNASDSQPHQDGTGNAAHGLLKRILRRGE